MERNQTFGTPVAGSTVSAAYTAAAGATTIVAGKTQVVRVMSTTDCYVAIGTAAVATALDMYLPANCPEYFSIPPGGVVSAMQVAAAGVIYATPMV